MASNHEYVLPGTARPPQFMTCNEYTHNHSPCTCNDILTTKCISIKTLHFLK